MEFISVYGLFLAKVATVVIAIAVLALLAVSLGQRKNRQKGELRLTDLGEQYRDMQRDMRLARMGDAEQKAWNKQFKKQTKADDKLKKQRAKTGAVEATKPCLYVLDFKGSMDAHEVTSLREEISAVLAVATPQDEVLLRLESPGGVVHGYGLASSQLARLRTGGIRLTVAVDKVAASGGYMMACVADRIVAAPFAIIGSIGVVAQIPNFHRLLKKNDIDVELHTAGEFKRTLTLFGENTEQGREKFREDLNDTHELFKQFVHQQRPSLDIDSVATGEHWFGTQAKDKGLIDAIGTSDDLLIAEMENHEVVGVRYARRKRMMDRFTGSAAESVDRLLLRWWQRGEKPLL
ncbi:protease SohB [Serratia proteamaculans]|uniref:protease SohB n=1 Tax=Serratia proteamaculans TaxID=28151 RepID=UPI000D8C935D|nr:protease SohB [Serratia proteamaculans]SPZ53852.1 Probable protease sohB [Serratia quinivorans]NWA71463.1 protease SohB [Serratia proteamaculans]CAI0754496.1 Probable protease sohB [Serratia proteamaculans]CAI0783245.1 Probable protease sohB [Serratia proteamaculans]CAI0784158.1 Probable protease sohB [Serratia proteamaculans]